MSLVQVSAAAHGSSAKARLIGLLILAAGVAFCWFFGYLPLQQAEAHAANVRYDPRIFLLGPLLLACGAILLVGGRAVAHAMLAPPRTRQEYVIVGAMLTACVAVGGLAWWWFDAKLRALGYVMHY